jgi:hypothetical protein
MTGAQWIWEYEALAKKEQEAAENNIEMFKMIKGQIIGLLGLSLMFDEKTLEKNPDLFMPWVIMGGRREIVHDLMEKFQASQAGRDAIDDPEFEKLSAAIARGDIGDMDPILDMSQLDLEKVKKQAQREDLQKAGVKIVDRKPAENAVHISFDREEMLKKARASVEEAQVARQAVKQEAQEQRKQTQGLSVLFDEDG